MHRHKFLTALGLILLYLCYLMTVNVVDVLVYSVFIYYIARPIYGRLIVHLKSQHLSAFISLFIILLPATLVALYGLGVASMELMNLAQTLNMPYMDEFAEVVEEYDPIISEVTPQDLVKVLKENKNIQDLWAISSTIVVLALDVFFRVMLTLTVALYLLMDGSKIRNWLVRNIYPDERGLTDRFLSGVDSDLHKVFLGSILTAFFIAIMGAVVFTALNEVAPEGFKIPYTILLGMVCGVASLVPVAGVAAFWVPASAAMTLYAYTNGTLTQNIWFIALFTASTAVFVDWGPNLMLKPQITRGQIHPGLMLLAYLLGPMTFGLAGLFLGPIVTVVTLNFAKTVLPHMRRY